MFSNFSIRQWTRNCFPSSLYTLQAKAWNRKIQNGQHKTPSQFMLQPSRNKWRALRQQEVWQITAPKTQFAMETTTLSIQNYVRCSRHTLSRLPLSRPALPVKGQGGGGRSRLRRAAILSTSANFALTTTSLHWYWWLSNAREKQVIPIRYQCWNGTEKCNLKCREWTRSIFTECNSPHSWVWKWFLEYQTVKLQWTKLYYWLVLHT